MSQLEGDWAKVKPEEYERLLLATLRVIAQQPPRPLLRLALHFAAYCADELMEQETV